jgi:hypothetical protein
MGGGHIHAANGSINLTIAANSFLNFPRVRTFALLPEHTREI